MRRTWRVCFGASAIGIALTSGCTTPTLSGPLKSALPLAGTKQPAGSNANSGGAMEAAASDPYGNMPQQVPSTSVTATGGVALASLLQAGKSVSNALRIQSKVTPAVDPVMLDNQPANTTQVAADLHYRAGFFKETQHDYLRAAEHYRNVLQKTPNDVRAVAGYGRVQDQLGNTVEAEQYLRRACELAPQEPAPWNDLANSHFRRMDLNAAITCEQRAVDLQPNNAQYRGNLAKFLVDSGRNDEAVQQLAAVHGEAMANLQVGCLLDERRQPDQARQHVERSLSLNPSLAQARQLLIRWQIPADAPRPDQGRTIVATRLPLP